MKAVILAGGLGTRLSEETETRPKPMVEIGGLPILWHIMGHYAVHSVKDFIVALGYKADVIKRFFMERSRCTGSISVNLETGKITDYDKAQANWNIDLIETGLTTNTGGRLLRVRDWLADDTFMLTYGDGLSDVDIDSLVKHHKVMGKLATVTAVRPPARFGGLEFDGNLVINFTEKPQTGEGWINGGFFILNRSVLNYIDGSNDSFETDVLPRLVAAGQLAAYRHEGFWQCMDTLRDKRQLEMLWQSGRAPWRTCA